jgi:hypothetical protein
MAFPALYWTQRLVQNSLPPDLTLNQVNTFTPLHTICKHNTAKPVTNQPIVKKPIIHQLIKHFPAFHWTRNPTLGKVHYNEPNIKSCLIWNPKIHSPIAWIHCKLSYSLCQPDHYKAYAGKQGMKDALIDADVGYGAFGGKTDSVRVKNVWSNPPLPQKSSWFGTKPQGYAWVIIMCTCIMSFLCPFRRK